MFTGLVEGVGTIVAVSDRASGRRLEIDAPALLDDVRLGDSIAVDGICLTVAQIAARGFVVDLVPATLARTTAAEWTVGRRVNLERAVPLRGRLGGHLVQGHIDGVGQVVARTQDGDALWLDVEVPPEVARVTVPQGSIAIDGVSLTVQDLVGARVRVTLVPHTQNVTTLTDRHVGDRVNVEADLIGKYVARLLAPYVVRDPQSPPGY